MTWNASDLALVISTSATAITALAGIAFPIWKEIRGKKLVRREELFRQLTESVTFCIKNIDKFSEEMRHQSMLDAFLNANIFPKRKADEQLFSDFESHRRMITLTAKQAGIDAEELEDCLAKLATIRIPYTIGENNELVAPPNRTDLLRQQHLLKEAATEHAAELQSKAISQLGVG